MKQIVDKKDSNQKPDEGTQGMSEKVLRINKKVQIAAEEYRNQLALVTVYATAVYNTNLPLLNYPDNFPNWAEFSEQFLKVKLEVGKWTSEVLLTLIEVPRRITAINELVQDNLHDSCTLADQVMDTKMSYEDRKSAARSLSTRLGFIQMDIKSARRGVVRLLSSVEDYKSSLIEQVKTLSSLAETALTAHDVSEEKVKEITKEIDELQKRVTQLTISLIALGAISAGLLIGTVVAISFPPFGWAVAPFTGIGAAVAGYYAALDGIELTISKALIIAKQDEMNKVSQDALTLGQTTKQFTTLSESGEEMTSHLAIILESWKLVEKPMSIAILIAERTVEELDNEQISSLRENLTSIRNYWDDACKATEPLKIEIRVAEGVTLVVGMSEDEVKQALGESESVPIRTYLLAHAA